MPSKGISKLETSSIGKLMAELCVQATFSVMLYNIYIITDTLFVSKGVGSTASGAIGVFSPVLVFVGGISSTLGVGSGSIISIRCGIWTYHAAGQWQSWLASVTKNIRGRDTMESLTKNRQNEEMLRKMVGRFFHPLEFQSYKELTEGYFNVAYEVTLSSGEAVILKVAPANGIRVMTYERNIMCAEVQAMEMALEHGGIPVPKVLGYDDSHTICESSYFFMEKLDGNSLHERKDAFTQEQINSIYEETGRIDKEINRIACPCFGYPGQPELTMPGMEMLI